jgi:hypothetical protein
MAEIEFAHQAPLIDRFHQTGSFVSMDLDRRCDNRFGKTVRLAKQRVHDLLCFLCGLL